MRVVVTGVSNDEARENYVATIAQKKAIAELTELTSTQRQVLLDQHPNGQVNLWGARPTQRNRSTFDDVEIGATVLIYRKGKFVAAGEVSSKFENPALAHSIWKRMAGSSDDFSLMFSIRDVRALDLPIAEYNQFVGNDPGWFVHGFGLVSAQKSALVYDLLEIDAVISPKDSGSSAIDIPLFDGDLDRKYQRASRREQSYLRTILLGKNLAQAKCALCGRVLPVRLLWASHIKSRSKCSDAEKLDIPNIAMLACVLGCDALFEYGYVGVDASGVVRVSNALEGAGEAAAYLWGRKCEAFTPARAKYFEWHWNTIFSRLPSTNL